MSPAANTALMDATQACLAYLCRELGQKPHVDAFIGSTLPPTVVGRWTFLISGGPEQTQNYELEGSSQAWWGNGQVFGQFADWSAGCTFIGRIVEAIRKLNTERPSAQTQIEPNVHRLQGTTHPMIDDVAVPISETEAQIVWQARLAFRVIYYNAKT